MKQRSDSLQFFAPLCEELNTQYVYFLKNYAWIKCSDVIGLALISDPIIAPTLIKYDLESEITTKAETQDKFCVSHFSSNTTGISPIFFAIEEFLDKAKTEYNSVSKRRKMNCTVRIDENELQISCIPTKKRCTLPPAYFSVSGSKNIPCTLCVNLNTLYSVLKFNAPDIEDIDVFVTEQGFMICNKVTRVKFLVYRV